MGKSGKKKSADHGSLKGLPFDIDDPALPKWIEDGALTAGHYPYDKKLKRDAFEAELQALQIELIKLQTHLLKSRERLLVIFEGRDSAGKGTCIGHFREHLNPRHARVIALTKPTEVEREQWYFQRYIPHFPSGGEIVLFDRSWYNRAGVEKVMGFATPDEIADFLREAPQLEGMLVRDGIRFFKFYLEIGRETQLERFHERRHDPLKRWKMSDMDFAAMARWDDYTAAKEDMFRFTHTTVAPWTVILANDQRRARLEAIRFVLHAMSYEGKDADIVGKPDVKIVGSGPDFFVRPKGAA
ncbi:MAG: polyphosphate kinase 2 [Hyphomicrobiaceae bacterium]